MRVAYVMSRFPKLSETFVLYEMVALERLGIALEIYPLLRERSALTHPEAAAFTRRAQFLPFLSWSIFCSHLWFVTHRPRAYFGAVWAALRGTWGSLNFFIGALGILPKTIHAARLMTAQGVTHVHCHFATHPALAGLVIRRLTGIPFSFVVHGSDLHVDRRMLPLKVAEAEFVVTVSEYNLRVVLGECGEDARGAVDVLHCGVDTSVFVPRQRSGRFTIACVGTLHEVKGQAYLVDACRSLVAAGVDLVCTLVGDGPDRQALARRIADAGLADHVQLMGSRTRADVADLLGRMDVLVAPSVPARNGKREGIPVALMEGMSAGLPVVASRISGIPELVEDQRTGLLVPPRDATAIAAALQRLASDPALRRRLGAAARAKVLRDFNLDGTARQLAARFHGGSPVPAAATNRVEAVAS